MFGLRQTTDSREHAPSYYADTALQITSYPQLVSEERTEVVVLGGGFTGVNTALELAERGYQVSLVEANRIGWGATGRNGGQVIGGLGHSAERFENRIGKEGVQAIYQMGLEGCEIIRERVAKYQIDCDLKWGYCDVALKPRHMKDFAEWKAHEEAMGNPHHYELLDADQLQEHVVSRNYCGGLLNRTGNGHLHPLNLCIGEARAATGQGVKIYEQSRVTAISQGEPATVHTDKGSISADTIVLCGNAYMGDLVPRLATRVLPSNSSVIATAPLPDSLAQELMPGDLAVCDPRAALDYFRLSADKRLLFGGLSNYTGLEPRDLEGTIRKKMEKVFPQLTGIDIDYGWSGQMGIGLNRMPQLGRLANNVLYLQAYSGHGVAPSHILSRITAEAISGAPERFDIISGISHWPFPGGKFLRRPALAIGMLYFKFLDAL